MSERRNNGQFEKGNQVAKGNNGGRPRRSVEDQLLARLTKVVTPEDFDKMILSLVSRAKAGDVQAARLVLGYLVGLPIQRTEVSGPEGGPVAIREVLVELPELVDENPVADRE